MPLPKILPGEDLNTFIARGMADATMLKEYPDKKQRYAVLRKLAGLDKISFDASELKDALAREGISFKRRKIKKPKPYRRPLKIEKAYTERLLQELEKLSDVIKQRLFPVLPRIVDDYKQVQSTIGLDGYVEDLDTAINYIYLNADMQAEGKSFEALASAIGADVNTYSLAEHTKVLKSALGVSPVSSEPWLQAKEAEFAQTNARLITKLNDDTIKSIEDIVKDGLRSGLRVEEIQKQIVEKIGLETLETSENGMSAANRARLITRDQVTKYYAELNATRQQNVGINKYIWQTANDERVRGLKSGVYPKAAPSHAVMDGKLCKWDDPEVYSDDGGKTWKQRSSIGGPLSHPGQPIQCRCYAEPYFNDILK